MSKPTGKLKFAYETIANMEVKINELKNKQPNLTIDKCIKHLTINSDKINFDQYSKLFRLYTSVTDRFCGKKVNCNDRKK